MATINLATKFSTKLDEIFKLGSVTDAYCGSDYDWDGVNTIKVWNLLTDELQDYTASGLQRYGETTEVSDEATAYTLSQKKSFSKTFDETNVQDTMFIRKGAAYINQMWRERYVPTIDKYRLGVWANGAGLGVMNTAALTEQTIVPAILNAQATMADAEVPMEDCVCYIGNDTAVSLKLASQLAYSQNWVNTTIVKNKIAEIGGMNVVGVPKSRMPAGVVFMIKYKRASADPMKLRKLEANDKPQGICGTLMEGLVRFDAFVLANKANGIFVYYNAGSQPVTAIAESAAGSKKLKFTLGASSTGTIKYTLDGSNPKTSSTAKTLTVNGAASATEATANEGDGAHVRACFISGTSGALQSPIFEADVAFTAAG